MWVDENRKAPVADFLGWLLFISVFAQIIMLILEPASVSNAETGKLTFAYVLYAIIGILFTTPASAVSLFIVLRKEELRRNDGQAGNSEPANGIPLRPG